MVVGSPKNDIHFKSDSGGHAGFKSSESKLF